MKLIFELNGKRYSNEQEIIDAGCYVIYCYCCKVKGRWRDIEPLMIKSGFYGYYYASDVIKGRYDPELETLYLMIHSGYLIEWYIRDLVSM